MKLLFNKFTYFVLVIIFISTLALAKEISSEYIVEKLVWSINMDATEYKISIDLEDRGFLSGLYSFSGSYSAEGKMINKVLIPSLYKQKWKTKKKNKNVELYFKNGKVSKLNLLPKEVVPPKIEYLGVGGAIDPLSSFLNILINNNSSKTIDGRRLYTMVVTKKNLQNNIIIKNIWADHNNNDLGSIRFEQINSDSKFVLPNKIKIQYKRLVFILNKI